MTRIASIIALAACSVAAAPAHASMQPNALVNSVNTLRGTASPQLGGGGVSPIGGGNPPIGCVGSPENTTVLLALLAGAGLFTGRKMTRARAARQSVPVTL